MPDLADILPENLKQLPIPPGWENPGWGWTVTPELVISYAERDKDSPLLPYFYAWSLDAVSRTSFSTGRRWVRQIIEMHGDIGIEAIARMVVDGDERNYRRSFYEVLEGKMPTTPGPNLQEALLEGVVAVKIEVRSTASARVSEMGPPGIKLLERAIPKATKARKNYYQQLLTELQSKTEAAPAAPITGNIKTARTLVQRGDFATALLEVRALWERSRDARLTDLLDRLADKIDRGSANFKTPRELAAWWESTARQKSPAEVGWLLPEVSLGNWKMAKIRYELLAEFPPDPRIARTVAQNISGATTDSSSLLTILRAGFKTLYAMGDPESYEPLKGFFAKNTRFLDSQATTEMLAGQTLRKHLDKLKIEPLSLGELDEVEAIGRALVIHQKLSKEDFLQAIYADPEADETRLVYADWLSERGDPRGELIMLQVADAAGSGTQAGRLRARKLIEDYGLSWAAELPGCRPEDVRFERGFPYRGVVQLTDNVPTVAEQEPAWVTVGRLVLRGNPPAQVWDRMLSHPNLRSVTEVFTGLIPAKSAVYPRIRVLGQNGTEFPARREQFPNLETLIVGIDPGGKLRNMADAWGVRTFGCSPFSLRIADAVDLWSRSLEKIHIAYYATLWDCILEDVRDAVFSLEKQEGRFSKLHVEVKDRVGLNYISAHLQGVKPGKLTGFSMVLGANFRYPQKEIDTFLTALDALQIPEVSHPWQKP